MRIRQVIRNNLSRTAASVALTLFMSLAAPVTAQALIPSTVPDTAVTLGSHFADTKKNTKKKDSKKKDSKKDSKGKKKGGGGGGGGSGGSGGGGGGDGCSGSSCSPTPTGAGQNCNEDHCDLVALYINPLINLLSIIVGLAIAASLVMGGIQYTASSGDSQKTAAAKSRISNTLLAFLAFAFMYAFLNFLIPGGLFK